MNQNKNLPIKIGLLYGACLGVIVVTIGIIRYKTGMILRGDQTLSYVYWCIFTLTIFYGVFRFKKLNPLSFSFSPTIKIGLFAGLLSGSIYTIYIVILNNYIDTELSSKIDQFSEPDRTQSSAELPNNEDTDSVKFTEMSSAVRGLIYTVVCMFFGITHSYLGTLVVKIFRWP